MLSSLSLARIKHREICGEPMYATAVNHLIWIRWGLLSYKDTVWIFPPGVNTIGQARNWRALSFPTLTQISRGGARHSFTRPKCSLAISFFLYHTFSSLIHSLFLPRDEGRIPEWERESESLLKVLMVSLPKAALYSMINIWPSTVLSFFSPSFFLIPPLEPEITFSAKGRHAQ